MINDRCVPTEAQNSQSRYTATRMGTVMSNRPPQSRSDENPLSSRIKKAVITAILIALVALDVQVMFMNAARKMAAREPGQSSRFESSV